MRTAVETIFVGKGRLYNRRVMQMCDLRPENWTILC